MFATGVMEVEVEVELGGVVPQVKDRLAVYFADVASGLVRSEQRRNAELYARGLIEAGARKSLEPMVARLGGGSVEDEAEVQSSLWQRDLARVSAAGPREQLGFSPARC